MINRQYVLHIMTQLFQTIATVSIETVDSDVVVLSFCYANIVKDSGVEKLSVVYGPKDKYFDVFDNLSYFGIDICILLLYFHALTG